MPGHADLRSFIDELRRKNDIVEIEVPVDPNLEIAEIHRRVIAAGGPALLFKNPKGASFPIVTNLFGTSDRARAAFGERPHAFIRDIVRLAQELMPPTPKKLWGARETLGDLLKVGLKRRRKGAILENVMDPPSLDRLPVIKSWSDDGGPFFTLPLVYTEHPEGIGPNLGMYRLHQHDASTTGMHWQIGKGGGFHYDVAEKRNEKLPVSVFLGGPPALIISAIAPLPENVPELMLASLILGKKLPLAETSLSPHPLVANAEFAMVGFVPPHERKEEGPFGDHYGYYSLQHPYPVFHVEKLFHRTGAIYPATVVGKPRQEDFFIGDLLQDLLSPLFPLVMPSVVDLWSYGETGYHSLAGAIVKERYHREAMASGFRILGEGQLSLTKFLLLTDGRVDLRDFRATLEHVLARTQVETDLYVLANLSMDTLDYTGPEVNKGSKGLWLGLGDPVRELPRKFQGDLPQGVSDVRVFCGGCLVVEAPSYREEPNAPARILQSNSFADWPLIVLTDDAARASASSMNFLWTTFTRFEPAGDLHSSSKRIVRNHIAYSLPILIDARMKPHYPEELHTDPETASLVTKRWSEYFPKGVEMGDSERAHLDPRSTS